MPLAKNDGARAASTVDRDIIAAASAPRPRGGSTSHTSSSPIVQQSTPLRSPTGTTNLSGHTNPVPANLFAPDRQALVERAIVDEMAMKAGALTTVPEVEDYTFKMPSRAEEVRDEVARKTGLRGQSLDMAMGYRAQQEQATGRPVQTDAEAEAEMSEAERAFKSGVRATRKGMREGGRADKLKAMTSDAFAALSPRQKAAVELNSMLTAAIEADLGVGQKGNPGGQKYDDAVEELFTGEGATARYAPNTVGVLENIGWSGPATDLDDILKGRALFTRQDIDDLGPEREGVAPDASLNTSMKIRDDIQSSLVKAFTSARKEPVQGENLLAAKQDLLDYKDMPGFSNKPGREVVPGVDLNSFFRSGFDLLSNSNTEFTPEQILADAKQNLTEQEFQQFLNFVDVNSRDAKNYRQPLGTNPEQTYFDPVEFRQSIAASLRKERGDARSRR
jgi:hypothetical protein